MEQKIPALMEITFHLGYSEHNKDLNLTIGDKDYEF